MWKLHLKTLQKLLKVNTSVRFFRITPMEPMNFFADVRADGVELIGPTQTPGRARTAVSKLLNIPEDKITVTITRLGWWFWKTTQD